MKKITALLLALFTVLCLLTGAAFAANDEAARLYHITDEADILTTEQEAYLESEAARISQEHKVAIYIVIVSDYRNYTSSGSVYTCAEEIYDYYSLGWDNGSGDYKRDGLILLMSMNDRDFAELTRGYIGNEAFNDPGLTSLENAFIPYFKNDDWYGGFCAFLEQAEALLESPLAEEAYISPSVQTEKYGYEKDSRTSGIRPLHIILAVAVSGLVSFIITGSMKRSMKTAVEKTGAADYAGSPEIKVRRDDFTHRTVRREEIPQSSPHGGGGGGHSSGGSSGHSGKF